MLTQNSAMEANRGNQKTVDQPLANVGKPRAENEISAPQIARTIVATSEVRAAVHQNHAVGLTVIPALAISPITFRNSFPAARASYLRPGCYR